MELVNAMQSMNLGEHHSNGKARTVTSYNADGKQKRVDTYDENGNLKQSAIYDYDTDIDCIRFYTDGQLTFEQRYERGMLVGCFGAKK